MKWMRFHTMIKGLNKQQLINDQKEGENNPLTGEFKRLGHGITMKAA
jgi:hypothetical protein